MAVTERDLLIALHHIPGIGPQKWAKLRAHFSDVSALLGQTRAQREHWLGDNGAQLLADWLAGRSGNWLGQRLAHLEAWLQQPEHGLITCLDDDYPPLLREAGGPLLLHLWGNGALLNLPQLAVVGSRKPTAAGRKATDWFCQVLAGGGFTITSGLALGVDGVAHEAALAAQGSTLAVLGCGLDQIYPAVHRQLAHRIVAAGGLVVSEFALPVRPEPGHFPRRNRIISGLSLGTLVVEAALKSGSLITARCALEQNREVFAIPGSIFSPVSEGCHWLIREGATLVSHPEQLANQLTDSLQLLVPKVVEVSANLPVDPAQRDLLALLGHERLDFETLLTASGMTVAALHRALSELELEAWIESSEMGYERRL